jgi:hypothetical protein
VSWKWFFFHVFLFFAAKSHLTSTLLTIFNAKQGFNILHHEWMKGKKKMRKVSGVTGKQKSTQKDIWNNYYEIYETRKYGEEWEKENKLNVQECTSHYFPFSYKWIVLLQFCSVFISHLDAHSTSMAEWERVSFFLLNK